MARERSALELVRSALVAVQHALEAIEDHDLDYAMSEGLVAEHTLSEMVVSLTAEPLYVTEGGRQVCQPLKLEHESGRRS